MEPMIALWLVLGFLLHEIKKYAEWAGKDGSIGPVAWFMDRRAVILTNVAGLVLVIVASLTGGLASIIPEALGSVPDSTLGWVILGFVTPSVAGGILNSLSADRRA